MYTSGLSDLPILTKSKLVQNSIKKTKLEPTKFHLLSTFPVEITYNLPITFGNINIKQIVPFFYTFKIYL